jgi:uncharacterized damage-inducible protein DinB
VKSRVELMKTFLDRSYRIAADNLLGLTLDEALFLPTGGYRSVLGTLKHMAGWSHIYRSFAFDAAPKGWREIAWPRGLRDTVEVSQSYLEEIVAWFDLAHQHWLHSLSEIDDVQVDLLRPLHWGATAPLFEIVTIMANHHTYHAGEINQLLAIFRNEAWEESEEVEENHISTLGHRVRPPWMD